MDLFGIFLAIGGSSYPPPLRTGLISTAAWSTVYVIGNVFSVPSEKERSEAMADPCRLARDVG